MLYDDLSSGAVHRNALIYLIAYLIIEDTQHTFPLEHRLVAVCCRFLCPPGIGQNVYHNLDYSCNIKRI